jgi:hypothetical protein
MKKGLRPFTKSKNKYSSSRRKEDLMKKGLRRRESLRKEITFSKERRPNEKGIATQSLQKTYPLTEGKKT